MLFTDKLDGKAS